MITFTWLHAAARARLAPTRTERGEGVISAAIVVLIMALLGAAMWVAVNRMWTTTETKTETNISTISS